MMIFPTKYDHPDQTVVSTAGIMIKYLNRYRVVEYYSLLQHCQSKISNVDFLFTPAISLLFLLGLVRYLPKSDSFEWVSA